MKTWTVDQMVKEGACYTPERIAELWARRTALALPDILALDIPSVDKMWVVWRPKAITVVQQQHIVEHIVARCIQAHALSEAVTKVWAENWLSGKDRTRKAAGAAGAAAGAAEYDRQVQDVLDCLEED
jgi:hypothetical protein